MRYVPLFLTALFFVGCASTNATILDSAPSDRSDVTASQVAVYSDTNSVSCPYDRVALLSTSNNTYSIQRKKAIKSAKKKAANINANVLVIDDISHEEGDPDNKWDFSKTKGEFIAIYEHRPCN